LPRCSRDSGLFTPRSPNRHLLFAPSAHRGVRQLRLAHSYRRGMELSVSRTHITVQGIGSSGDVGQMASLAHVLDWSGSIGRGDQLGQRADRIAVSLDQEKPADGLSTIGAVALVYCYVNQRSGTQLLEDLRGWLQEMQVPLDSPFSDISVLRGS
jgi:hypothetical protein